MTGLAADQDVGHQLDLAGRDIRDLEFPRRVGLDDLHAQRTVLVEDLGADSLDTVELVMALEEEFETEIPDEEAEKITTVKEAIDYIEAHG